MSQAVFRRHSLSCTGYEGVICRGVARPLTLGWLVRPNEYIWVAA